MVLKDAIGQSEDNCATCGRPPTICVCDRAVALLTKRRVLILQHPQEKDVLLGTASLVAQSLKSAKLVVGISWSSLAQPLGDEDEDPKRWAVLFPDKKTEGAAQETEPGIRIVNRHGQPVPAKKVRGLVVLDGSWSQAKTLWWRNPWLLKLNRVTVFPTEPSIYGRLRVEPRNDYVSTLEAIGRVLTVCGEGPEVELGLKRIFRTLVQRARDAGTGPARRPRRRPPKADRC